MMLQKRGNSGNRRNVFLVLVLCIVTVYLLNSYLDFSQITRRRRKENGRIVTSNCLGKETCDCKQSNSLKYENVTMVFVACGMTNIEEAMVAIKSAILLRHDHVTYRIYFYTQKQNEKFVSEKFTAWPESARINVETKIVTAEYPKLPRDVEGIKTMIGSSCKTLRLFLPELLPNEDAVMYMDTDVIFLAPPVALWRKFPEFSSVEHSAIAPINLMNGTSWMYERKMKIYPPYGISSGVILMNLTRMRQVKMTQEVLKIYKEHGRTMELADQALLNHYFHYNPHHLYLLPCEWNYIYKMCQDTLVTCPTAFSDGIKILHGISNTFHSPENVPPFAIIFNFFKNLSITTDIKQVSSQLEITARNRNIKYKKSVKYMADHNCGKRPHLFVKQMMLFANQKKTNS